MISDGFGPASETFARSYLQYLVDSKHPSIQKGGRWESLVPTESTSTSQTALPLDSLLIGTSRTKSSDSLVTDSAAGATAFSCALKSYNGAVAVEPNERAPCGTLLEAAKHLGYRTGLVVTSVGLEIVEENLSLIYSLLAYHTRHSRSVLCTRARPGS